ncbi:ExbD/TolR family protein [Polycladidibacter hongkongensis]|uniref:ExbD/TolR family protein n=1 Tax=Polycladidibacter hongkongensis TaxID=1647556 RepID=UPI00082B96DB|nr:biopolymer transporter ExbD [Pseudovibrio hongkongensis]
MRLAAKKTKPPVENTIPLINIVFLMLIFFLFAGTLERDPAQEVSPAITQDMPQSERAAEALQVTSGAKLFYGDTPVEVEDLKEFLVEKEISPDAPLRLVPDKELSARKFAKILSELRKYEFDNVVLLTKREK